MTKPALKSLIERTLWTIAQAAIGVLVVVTQNGSIPNQAWYAVPIAGAVAALKSFVASKVGDPNTAAFDKAPEGAV